MKKRHQFMFGNLLNGFGYLMVLMQWLWILILILPPLFEAGVFDMLVDQPKPEPIVQTTNAETSPIMMSLAIGITIIVLAVTIYILLRLPVAIARTGERVTETTTRQVLPIITHHKPIPKAKKKRLTMQLKFYLCLLVSLLPVLALFFTPAAKDVPKELVILVETFLAVMSVVVFSSAYLLQVKR